MMIAAPSKNKQPLVVLKQATPPVDFQVFESWRMVLQGVTQVHRVVYTPRDLAQCFSMLLLREKVEHEAWIGTMDERDGQREAISAWITFKNGTHIVLVMPSELESMNEEDLLLLLGKKQYRSERWLAPCVDNKSFQALAGLPLEVFRSFGRFYDESSIVHTALPKTEARQFRRHLQSAKTLKNGSLT